MREEKFKSIANYFFDYLKREESVINSNFNSAKCRAYIHYPSDVNIGVGYFSMGIDCLLLEADNDKTDNLVFEILVFDENNVLEINADICWGHPYGKVEEKLYDKPINITQEILEELRQKIPNFISKLRELIIEYPQGI